MEKEKREKLRIKIEKEKSSLEEIIKGFAKENKSSSGDWNTRFPNFKAEGTPDEEADEVEEYSSLLPIERTLEIKLQNINDALKKMADGKYGKCEVCGKDIEGERLDLVPETKTCNSCKQ